MLQARIPALSPRPSAGLEALQFGFLGVSHRCATLAASRDQPALFQVSLRTTRY